MSRLVTVRGENPDDLAPVSTLGRREWRQEQDHSHSGAHMTALSKNAVRGGLLPFLEGFFLGNGKGGSGCPGKGVITSGIGPFWVFLGILRV